MTRSGILPYIYNSNKPGTKAAIPGVNTVLNGVETPTPPVWFIPNWLGYVEPAPSGEHKLASPKQKSLHTSETPTHRRRKDENFQGTTPRHNAYTWGTFLLGFFRNVL